MTIRSTARCFVLLLGLALLAPLAIAAEVGLDVSANRNSIYEGESFDLTIRVSGSDRAERPDLSALQDCKIQYLGDHRDSRVEFAVINGKMEQRRFLGRTYAYRITPLKTGSFRAGPVRMKVKSKEVAHSGPLIRVTGIEKQDLVLIEITPSRESCLVDQPFDVTLSIMLKCLSGRYADAHPLLPREPPHLQADFLDPEPFRGMDPDDVKALLGKVLARGRTPGFKLNGYTIRGDIFDLSNFFSMGSMNSDKPARFLFDSRMIQRDGKPYRRYDFKVSFTPKEERSYTFGPAVFKGKVVTAVDAGGNPSAKPVMAVGPARTVRVIPPPEAGRPASYTGIIGTGVVARATLDAQTCNVGDPLTLSLQIAGPANMRNSFPPVLGAVDGLSNEFRVYDDNVQSESNDRGRTYRYRIRPIRAGTLEVPPLEISFYDPEAKRYRTIQTQPIPVRANPSPEVRPMDIIGPAPGQMQLGTTTGDADLRIPAPLAASDSACKTQSIAPPTWQLTLAAVLPLAYGGLLAGLFVSRRSQRLQDARRRHQALDRARLTLRNADPGNAAAISQHLRQYLADRFTVPGSGLTPTDARQLLDKHGVADDVAKPFCSFMETAFNATFATGDTTGNTDESPLGTKAITELESLDRATQPRRTRRAIAPPTVLLLLTFALSVMARQADVKDFIWREAGSRMATARTPEQFTRAAQVYRRLAGQGVENGILFYNMGTAYLLAEDYPEAIAALTRAERYLGSTWEIQRNLLLAYAGKEKNLAVTLPWYRLPLYWHFRMPWAARISAALLAFCALWIGLLAQVARLKRSGRIIVGLSLVACIVFGSSAAASALQESRARRTIRMLQADRPIPAQAPPGEETNP